MTFPYSPSLLSWHLLLKMPAVGYIQSPVLSAQKTFVEIKKAEITGLDKTSRPTREEITNDLAAGFLGIYVYRLNNPSPYFLLKHKYWSMLYYLFFYLCSDLFSKCGWLCKVSFTELTSFRKPCSFVFFRIIFFLDLLIIVENWYPRSRVILIPKYIC